MTAEQQCKRKLDADDEGDQDLAADPRNAIAVAMPDSSMDMGSNEDLPRMGGRFGDILDIHDCGEIGLRTTIG